MLGDSMLILVDDDGRKAVEVLCHIALRLGGLENRNLVNTVLDQAMRRIELPASSPVELKSPEGGG